MALWFRTGVLQGCCNDAARDFPWCPRVSSRKGCGIPPICFGASSRVALEYHTCVSLGFFEKALSGLPIRSWGALHVGLEVLPRGVLVVLLRYLGVSSHNPLGVLECLPGGLWVSFG